MTTTQSSEPAHVTSAPLSPSAHAPDVKAAAAEIASRAGCQRPRLVATSSGVAYTGADAADEAFIAAACGASMDPKTARQHLAAVRRELKRLGRESR